jgi:hypothetical protein
MSGSTRVASACTSKNKSDECQGQKEIPAIWQVWENSDQKMGKSEKMGKVDRFSSSNPSALTGCASTRIFPQLT